MFVNKFLPVFFAEKLFIKVGCCCCLAQEAFPCLIEECIGIGKFCKHWNGTVLFDFFQK